MTFVELYTFVLEATSRPTTFTTKAKLAVNLAVKQALNLHQFAYNADFATISYTAGAETVDWRTLLPNASSIIKVVQLSANGSLVKNLPVYTYSKILEEFTPTVKIIEGTEVSVGETQDVRKAFIVGDKLGIHPKPTTAVSLRVLYYKKIADLSADSDTNFLTEYCSDLITDLALQRFNYFLKEDERYPVTESQIKRSLQAAQLWDTNLVNNSGIDWS